METCFEEEFNNKQEIGLRLLNHNKRTYRKEFVEMCEKLLNTMPIETELWCVEMWKNRAKMEHVDKEVTRMLKKQEIKQKEREKVNYDAKKNF